MILDDIKTQLSSVPAQVAIVHVDQEATYPCVVLEIEEEKRNYNMTGRSCSGGEDGGNLVWGWISFDSMARSFDEAWSVAKAVQCIIESAENHLEVRHTGYYPTIDASDKQIYVVHDVYKMPYYETCETEESED